MMNAELEYRHARRMARRFDGPHLEVPTCVRRQLQPKVKIGCMRDPALPIEITPAIHIPPKSVGLWQDVALWSATVVAIVTSFVFVGW